MQLIDVKNVNMYLAAIEDHLRITTLHNLPMKAIGN
jgi:hypothetical protein